MSEGHSQGGGQGTPAAPAKKLSRPIAQVRAELLADPDVREQARLLKLPVADYVEKILDYATHPTKPPQVQVLPDEALKARDPSIPTVQEIHTHLEKIVNGEIVISPAHQKDGYNKHDGKSDRYASMVGAKAEQKKEVVAEEDKPYEVPEVPKAKP
jgi:hypothetical protein